MPRVRVLSFNTHYGLRPVPAPRGSTFDLVDALAPYDADVIVLQEVWRPAGRPASVDLLAAARGFHIEEVILGAATEHARWPRFAGNGEGTVGVAVLSSWPMERVATPRLGPVPMDPAPGRQALHVRLDVDGTALDVVGVHLTSRLPHGPPMQLRRLAPNLPDREGPALVAGDCNFWGPPTSLLVGPGWRRAVRGRSWPAHRPHSQIDHVLVTRSISVHEGEVLPDLGSDHRPIRATLAIP